MFKHMKGNSYNITDNNGRLELQCIHMCDNKDITIYKFYSQNIASASSYVQNSYSCSDQVVWVQREKGKVQTSLCGGYNSDNEQNSLEYPETKQNRTILQF